MLPPTRQGPRRGSGVRSLPRLLAAASTLLFLLWAAVPAAAQPDLKASVTRYIEQHQREIVGELVGLLSIPNVAADRANIQRNAEHLREMLIRRGFAAEVLATEGNPLVYGELQVPGATRTLLLYSHYDGQPVDPAGWRQASPFTPVLRAGRLQDGAREIDLSTATAFDPEWRLYARSAADDKSPIVALCAALDALEASGLRPTSNVRVILDGEEEASSPSLVPAISRYRDKFNADLMLIFDGPAHAGGPPSPPASGSGVGAARGGGAVNGSRGGVAPTVAFGARGILTGRLIVYGPRSGVHSGNYGNWIPNPALRLAHLLASMKDDAGRVQVAGFYDGIEPLTAEERALLAAVPDDGERMLRAFGVAQAEVEGRGLQESLQIPTLNIRGLASAHVGDGARTIIPDRAVAELDIRLVLETRGEAMKRKLEAHLRAQGYHLVESDPGDAERVRHPRLASLQWRETVTEAFRTSPLHPESRALVAALARTHGVPPIQIRTLGGTVPIAPFIEALGFPAALVPIVNFDNNQHEENENLRLGHFFDGIVTIAAVLRM
jgi:acetylornithine deacetylase/succinyl-diaminopimelate desuccinylase-like protein